MSFLAELWRSIRVRRRLWLLPILILMIIFGGLMILTKGGDFGLFNYSTF